MRAFVKKKLSDSCHELCHCPEVKELLVLMSCWLGAINFVLPPTHSMALPSLYSELVFLEKLQETLQKRSFQSLSETSRISDEIVP